MALDRFRLDASHRNDQFLSWRLGQTLVSAQAALPIGRNVWGAELEGPELVKSLQTSYHNNLFVAGDRAYFLAGDGDDGICLQVASIGDDSQGVQIERATVVQSVKPQDRSTCLCPSLVAVRPDTGSQGSGVLLLLSTGYGDLHLIRAPAQADGTGAHSVEASCPSTPDALAISLQAAHQQSPGVFKIAAWRLSPESSSTGRRLACEVVLMHATLGGSAQLLVQHTTVLQVGRRPPQQVLIDPEGLAVLVVAAPEDAALQQPAGAAAHAGLGTSGAASASTLAAGAAAGGAAAGPSDLPGDDDMDDMDPELLRQAAARLAQCTSSEQAGPGAQGSSQPWTDLFREAGPSGEGELENDPSSVIRCYRQPLQPAIPGKEDQLPTPSWQLSLEPHRLLTACAAPSSRRSSTLLLGAADDVDCAVLEVTAAREPNVMHVRSVPALAYVVAGKLQRRHLLLTRPGSELAAVLVEQQRYCFLYRAVPQGANAGVQQVVQLDCGEDERVVGAALMHSGGREVLLVLGEARMHVLIVVA